MLRYSIIIITAVFIGPAYSEPSENLETTRCNNHIKIYLYTKTHPGSYFIEWSKTEESIKNSSIDFNKQTKFISYTHTLQSTDINFPEIIRKMVDKLDANVIVIEWPLLSKRSANEKDIGTPQSLIEGLCISWLLKSLGNREEVDPTKFHLIAFGDKVPAFVFAVKQNYPLVIGRLTGLDPVYDNFSIKFLEMETTKTMGMNFVDIIYTSLLFSDDIIKFGHASFFPNGGLHPQCGVPDNYREQSAIRSLQYFVESIDKPDALVAKKCDSWFKYVANECCNNESNKLGEYTSTIARGNFYLVTNDKSPYGLVSCKS